MITPRVTSVFSVSVAVSFLAVAIVAGFRDIGLPPVVIVGGSGLVALVMWVRTYLRRPLDPAVILPVFLLTVVALEVHMVEEYLTGFGPAMSRLFDISWTERSFLLVFAFAGPILYTLTALGLYYRVPLAGFLAWFIFIGPGVAEFTHFIFPLRACAASSGSGRFRGAFAPRARPPRCGPSPPRPGRRPSSRWALGLPRPPPARRE